MFHKLRINTNDYWTTSDSVSKNSASRAHVNPLVGRLNPRQGFGHRHGFGGGGGSGGGGGFGGGGNSGGGGLGAGLGAGGDNGEDNGGDDGPTTGAPNGTTPAGDDGEEDQGTGSVVDDVGKLASGMMDTIQGVCDLRKDLLSVQEGLPDLSSLTDLLGKRQESQDPSAGTDSTAAGGDTDSGGALDVVESLFSGLMDALEGACNFKSEVSSFASDLPSV